MTEIKEAHDRALEAADGHPLDKECCDILFREYLASMASRGFVMVSVEATEKMAESILHESPNLLRRYWRAMVGARPKLDA